MTSRRRAGLWDIQPGSFGLIVGVLLMANSVRAGEAVNRPTPLDQADFHVALNGKDTNPGTAAAPFATLPRARDAVREKRKLGQDRDILVAIHGGRYCLTEPLVFGPEDSGSDKHSITYAAGQGEDVVLSGGRAIAGWKKADAGPLWTVELPEVKAGRWYFRQLFVNGRRAVRARTPNADDKVPWWKIKTSTFKGQDASPIVLSVDHRIPAWKNAADVELVYVRNNDGSRKRLGAVDEAAQTFTLPPPHEWYPKILPGDFRVDQPTPGLSCYLENALEMLDEPGEWYLDRATGVLSYWPRPGEDLKEAEAIAPVVQTTLLAVAGARQNPVRNLRFRGIRVEHGRDLATAFDASLAAGRPCVIDVPTDPDALAPLAWLGEGITTGSDTADTNRNSEGESRK